MKHKTVFGTALTLGSLVLATASLAAVQLQSERGDIPVSEEFDQAPQLHQYQKDGLPIERNYLLQPPLIPHQIEGYRNDLNFHTCMACHAWSKAKEAGATKVSLTHVRDQASGAELANISPSRYFCNQCHVPQVEARPLVGNSFKPVDALAQPGRR